MNKKLPAWLILCVVAIGAGLLLAATDAITGDAIDEQNLRKADQARRDVLPGAAEFVVLSETVDAVVHEGKSRNGDTVGHTVKATAKGYGGEIEVTVGLDGEGLIQGVHVGGPNFAETAGLGAKAKDAAFTDQFKGQRLPATVDAISGATITSDAVLSAVNGALSTYENMAPEQAPTVSLAETPDAYPASSSDSDMSALQFTEIEKQPDEPGADAWWTAKEGLIVQTSEGDAEATISVDKNGTLVGISVAAEGLEKADLTRYMRRAQPFEEPEGPLDEAVNKALIFAREKLGLDDTQNEDRG